MLNFFKKTPPKSLTISPADLRAPTYKNRYPGATVLLLATGPSMKDHSKKVQKFIEKEKPLIFGLNRLPEGFIVDYHCFWNRRRFINYGSQAKPNKSLLLSRSFTPQCIEKTIGTQPHEFGEVYNLYPGSKGQCLIHEDGRVELEAGTVATIASSIAVVMGAQRLVFAGMDGYQQPSGETHYYKEEDDKEISELLSQQRLNQEVIDILKKHTSIDFLTPSAYH